MEALQQTLLPAVFGTVAVVYSNIQVMGLMNKIRYGFSER
jgi:hypothetical protein